VVWAAEQVSLRGLLPVERIKKHLVGWKRLENAAEERLTSSTVVAYAKAHTKYCGNASA
jgi:hypothetical protein